MALGNSCCVGKLRNKITLQRYTATRSAEGGNIRAFTTLGEVWARINPLLGQERVIGDKNESVLTHRVTIRHFPGLMTEDRFIFKGLVYNITAVKDPNFRGDFMILDCSVNEKATP